jgi:hypothetical protein
MNFHIIRQRHHNFSTDLSTGFMDRLGAKCAVAGDNPGGRRLPLRATAPGRQRRKLFGRGRCAQRIPPEIDGNGIYVRGTAADRSAPHRSDVR